MNPDDKIFVVMPVLNLWDEYTIHCMESLHSQQCQVPFEIVIVDQHSSDQTVSKAKDFEGRKMLGRVHVIENQENTGCAGGWNQGVKFALEHGATHILIANNDVLFSPFALQALYTRINRDPHVLLVSCVDVIKELIVPQMVLDPAASVNHKEDTESPHPNFSAFMITPETIEKVGWFDEEFFPAYHEDNSYDYRIKLIAGPNTSIANTTAVFIHYGSRTQNQVGGGIVPGPVFLKNRDTFIRMWGGPPGNEKFVNPYNDKTLSARKSTNAKEFDKIG